jgi:phosphorylated CTD-interacting factor 1
MELMAAELGVSGECFASPLNCVFPCFCSAFEDTDAAFGSQGSFFAWAPDEGCFEVNPPFDHTVAVRTAERMNSLLDAARVAEKKLGFVVVLPYSDRGKPLASLNAVVSSMRAGGFVQAEASVPAMECDYVDGMQHCALDTSFVARLDTRIFVLQSPSLAAVTAAEDGAKAVVDGWIRPTDSSAQEKRHRAEGGL